MEEAVEKPRRHIWAYLASGALAAGIVVAGVYWLRIRYATAAHLPPRYFFGGGRLLRGVVLAVNDGDNVRVFHTPLLRYFSYPRETGGYPRGFMTENTIHVRLAGIDAPESAYFGKPGQPFSREAKEHLQSLALGQRVTVRVHARDQYQRVVGTVYIHRWGVPWTNLSLALVQAGLATIYDGANAVHGDYLARLRSAEAAAQKKKKGMWVLPPSQYESPMAFKKRIRGNSNGSATVSSQASRSKRWSIKNWWRLF